jgi:hypothetical protein
VRESELLSPRECRELMELLVEGWLFKVGSAVERKVE